MGLAKPEEIQWPMTARTVEGINTNFDRLFRFLRDAVINITNLTTIVNTPGGATAPHNLLDGGVAHLDTDLYGVETGALIVGRGSPTALSAWLNGADIDLLPSGLNESGQKFWVDGLPMVGAYDYTYAWTRRSIGNERDRLVVYGQMPTWQTDPIQAQTTGFTITAGTIPKTLTVDGDSAINQNVRSTATPQFNGVLTPFVYPLTNGVNSFSIRKADGVTNVINVNTNNNRFGVNCTPANAFDVESNVTPMRMALFSNNTSGPLLRAIKARGTATSPLRTKSGDQITGINGFTYTAVDDVTTAVESSNNTCRVAFSAAEDQTSSAQGNYFQVFCTPVGSTTAGEKFRIDGKGNVGIGTTGWGTDAQFVLGIKNGTVPTSSPADMVQLYAEDVAASSELRVRDEGGTVTTLSPHNFSLLKGRSEAMAWSHYSQKDGTEINVDMLRVVRLVEWLTGESLVAMRGPEGEVRRQQSWRARWRRFVFRFLMLGCPA